MRQLLVTMVLVVVVWWGISTGTAHTDPSTTALPSLQTGGLKVGDKGSLFWDHGTVVQVMDDDWLLVSLRSAKTGKGPNFNLLIKTDGGGKLLADGSRINCGDWPKYLNNTFNVQCTGVKRLKDTNGATNSFFTLEPLR